MQQQQSAGGEAGQPALDGYTAGIRHQLEAASADEKIRLLEAGGVIQYIQSLDRLKTATPSEAMLLMQGAGWSTGALKACYDYAILQPGIQNLVGFMRSQLAGGLEGSEPIRTARRDSARHQRHHVNFTERSNDFERLEKLELERLRRGMDK
jgi:hypothetical protein